MNLDMSRFYKAMYKQSCGRLSIDCFFFFHRLHLEISLTLPLSPSVFNGRLRLHALTFFSLYFSFPPPPIILYYLCFLFHSLTPLSVYKGQHSLFQQATLQLPCAHQPRQNPISFPTMSIKHTERQITLIFQLTFN